MKQSAKQFIPLRNMIARFDGRPFVPSCDKPDADGYVFGVVICGGSDGRGEWVHESELTDWKERQFPKNSF